MAKVLLYNIGSRYSKLRLVLMKLGLRTRDVKPEEFGEKLGYIAGLDGCSASDAPDDGEPFSDAMMVLSGLTDAQINSVLSSMRQSRVPAINLKAIITEHNVEWSSYTLHAELMREHEAMRSSQGFVHSAIE